MYIHSALYMVIFTTATSRSVLFWVLLGSRCMASQSPSPLLVSTPKSFLRVSHLREFYHFGSENSNSYVLRSYSPTLARPSSPPKKRSSSLTPLVNRALLRTSQAAFGWWNARHGEIVQRGWETDKSRYRSWEDRFEDSGQQPWQADGILLLKPAERDALLSTLRSMLSFRPGSRPSAEALACE